jgi:putative colanic acid biosynthesis acetyltransferase WcaF
MLNPFFSLSPRIAWGWRRFLLRVAGAKVGVGAHIYPSSRITIPWNLNIGNNAAIGDRTNLYALGPISIGNRATVSQGVHLCAGSHDYKDCSMPLIKGSIDISSDVWICADAFIGPNVFIGERAVVGARAVVMKDVVANVVVAGNPARIIKSR